MSSEIPKTNVKGKEGKTNTPRYDDDPTFLSHLSAPLVSTSLFSWSTSIPNLWTSDPLVQNFTLLSNDMTFSKPEFAKASNPYIVVESLTYTSGGVHHVMDHWEEEVAAARNETGTLLFGVYGDPTNGNRLWTLAAYESEQYWREVHEKSGTAKEVEEHTRGMRTGKVVTALEKKGGFLWKGVGGCG